MSSRSFVVVNAFADGPFGGNPAGVFCYADGLSDELMLSFTRQMNLVECVFVLPATDPEATRRLRYFTPSGEIPVAGHPSIAAWSALAAGGHIGDGVYVQENLAGLQSISVTTNSDGGHHVAMTQPPATIAPAAISPTDIGAVFGLDERQLAEAPISTVHSGLGHLVVQVTDLRALMQARRNVGALHNLCLQAGVREAQLFCKETYSPTAAWHTRNICPRDGLEDPACGVGNGALAVHLSQHFYGGHFRCDVEQGHLVSMPSKISIEVTKDATTLVGGASVIMVEGRFLV